MVKVGGGGVWVHGVCVGALLVPDFEETVPGSGRDGHAIFCHSQAADAVVVAR